MIVLIDNYDSFSYNLYQLLAATLQSLQGNAGVCEEGRADDVTRNALELRVIRNDELTVDELAALQPQALVLSPGPGRPADAGICEEAVRALSGKVPILGVCLGHQAICEAFGATVTYATEVMHGKSSVVEVDESCPLFAGLGPTTQVGRYHSLAADSSTLPAALRVCARTSTGEVMAVQHAEHPTFGVQFHPESILTPQGRAMAEGFLRIVVNLPHSGIR